MTAEDAAGDHNVIESMINALLDRDGEALGGYLRDLDDELGFRAMVGAATVAVYRRWPEDPSNAEIADYAAAVGERSTRAGTVVAPAAVEALILTAFGEQGQIKGLSVTELLPAAGYLVHSIQDEGFLPDAERQGFIDEIVEAAV